MAYGRTILVGFQASVPMFGVDAGYAEGRLAALPLVEQDGGVKVEHTYLPV